MSKAKVEQKLTILLTVFTIIVLFWGQIGQSYLALGGAKLRKSSKVEFIGANSDFGGANSDFGGVEMVPVPPVLAQIVQNEPRWAELALKKLGPIWLLGSIWLFSFYSADLLFPKCDIQLNFFAALQEFSHCFCLPLQ